MKQAEKFTSFHGKLGSSKETLADALEMSDAIDQSLERLYAYAHMKLDEDNGNSESQARLDKVISALSKASALTSFATPEIVSIPEETMMEYIEE